MESIRKSNARVFVLNKLFAASETEHGVVFLRFCGCTRARIIADRYDCRLSLRFCDVANTRDGE